MGINSLLYDEQRNINAEKQKNALDNYYKISIIDLRKNSKSAITEKNKYLNIKEKCSLNYKNERKNIQNQNILFNKFKKYKSIKYDEDPNFDRSIIKNIKLNNRNIKKPNYIKEDTINEKKYISKSKYKYNNIKGNLNIIKPNYNKLKKTIMKILMLNLYIINILINFVLNESKEIIKFYSYEIKLKVKGTGTKNILSASSSYIYQCPTIIYINELIQDVTDCHFVDIKNPDSEIKLVWNNINIQSTKGMFYNCNEITEIDMIKFDTSLVTDMSNMFSMCTSLKSIKVDNLVTSKVETFENMFYNCTSLTSLNLESFTNPSAISLTRMFYGCINLEYINIKNFEEKENINLDDMFYNIPQNTVICLLSCPPPTNFTISTMTATTVRISWEGNEWNKFIISYDLQNLENPEDGNKIYVTDKSYYIFTNLDIYKNRLWQ